MRRIVTFLLVGTASAAFMGCEHEHQQHGPHVVHSPHHDAEEGSRESSHSARTRPTNQVAVLTVWASTDALESTASFYNEVLHLRRVGSSTDHHVFDTDGTFVVVMEGSLEHPKDPARRWPMFALTVPDLDASVETLRAAEVPLPWGVEEYGEPEPSSRYVMFHDPAGNLIEIVEWLEE